MISPLCFIICVSGFKPVLNTALFSAKEIVNDAAYWLFLHYEKSFFL